MSLWAVSQAKMSGEPPEDTQDRMTARIASQEERLLRRNTKMTRACH